MKSHYGNDLARPRADTYYVMLFRNHILSGATGSYQEKVAVKQDYSSYIGTDLQISMEDV